MRDYQSDLIKEECPFVSSTLLSDRAWQNELIDRQMAMARSAAMQPGCPARQNTSMVDMDQRIRAAHMFFLLVKGR